MTEHIDHGGPAFPVSTGDPHIGHQDGNTTWQFPGMTLRDYFATKASEEDILAQAEVIRDQQVTASGFGILPNGWRPIARYMHADAMLKARAAR